MLDASYNLIWLKGVLLLNYYITCTFYNGHNGIKHFWDKIRHRFPLVSVYYYIVQNNKWYDYLTLK